MATKEAVIKATGSCEMDDLDRANCNLAGNIGHQYCGWCTTHDKPRFHCGCIVGVISRAPAQKGA